jgi:hypothetical protein
MQTRVPERSQAARAGFGKGKIFKFGIIVGEAEPMEH